MTVRKMVRDMLIKELQIANPQEEEHIRIELYKKLQSVAPSLKLRRDNFELSLSELNMVLANYGYKLAWDEISIPIVKIRTETENFGEI